MVNRRIQIRSDDPIREISDLGRPRSDVGWTSSQLREELIISRKISDPISDLGRPISGLGRPISGLRRPISGLQRPISGLGRPISGLGRPRSDIGWTSSRLREELIGSWKISDLISESDVRPDQIWIHLMWCTSTIQFCLCRGINYGSQILYNNPGFLRSWSSYSFLCDLYMQENELRVWKLGWFGFV
jgi:hypothetical protein